MYRIVILLSFIALLGLTSCQKTVPTKACFTLSKTTAKVNDTIYILNCSENYKKFIWYSTSGFYPGGLLIDSTQRHQKVVVTALGQYPIILRVGEYNFYSNSTGSFSESRQIINVNP